jgi:hypothetical protein
MQFPFHDPPPGEPITGIAVGRSDTSCSPVADVDQAIFVATGKKEQLSAFFSSAGGLVFSAEENPLASIFSHHAYLFFLFTLGVAFCPNFVLIVVTL